MCVVSFVGDHYQDRWTQPPYEFKFNNWNEVSKEDFEALKKEVEELRQLLKKAIKYDEENGEPECQMEDKVELLRKVAKLVGVELEELKTNTNVSSSTLTGVKGTTWRITQ